MKKKVMIIAGVVFFLTFLVGNTSYAKSVTKKITAILGSYVIQLNGKAQKTTTLETGSKVYIPISELNKLTGAQVKKSGKNYNIIPVKKEDGITNHDIEKIKSYNYTASAYNDIADTDYRFYSLGLFMQNEVRRALSTGDQSGIHSAAEWLKSETTAATNNCNKVDKVIKYAKTVGVPLNKDEVTDIGNSCLSVASLVKQATIALTYVTYGTTNTDLNSFYKSAVDLTNESLKDKASAEKGYIKFFNKGIGY